MATVSELEQIFRYRVDDLDSGNYLWSSEEFLDYLNLAHYEATERSSCIVDASTDAVTKIDVVSGENEYTLHPAVLRLCNRPYMPRSKKYLNLYTDEQVAQVSSNWVTDTNDNISALVTNSESNKIITYPTFIKEDYTLPIITGINQYELSDEQMTFTHYFSLSGVGTAIPIYTVAEVEEISPTWLTDTGATVLGFVTGYISNGYMTYPTPTADDSVTITFGDTIRLTVIRAPLTVLSLGSDTPEIPVAMHQDLLWWCMRLAYQKRDSETYKPDRSAECDMEFTRRFGPKLRWRNQQFLKYHYNTLARRAWI